MNSDLRCTIVGHSAQIVAICINEKCQNQRGLCGICFLKEIHNSDQGYSKDLIITLNQFNERLIEKSRSHEMLINDYAESIQNLRYQYKRITDSLQQMIRQEEHKLNELKDRQVKLALQIKNLSQVQITNNMLCEMIDFYFNQQVLFSKDTKVCSLFEDIDKLLDQHKQTRIKLIKKDNNLNSLNNLNNQQQNNPQMFAESLIFNSQVIQQSSQNNQLYLSQEQVYHIQSKNVQSQDPSVCQQLVDHKKEILIAQISPNGFMIASSDTENILLLWNTVDFQAQQKYVNNCHILSLCFSDDSKWLFVGDDQGFLKIFDLNVGLKPQILYKLQDSAIIGIFQISQNYLLQDMNGHIYNCQYENYKFTLIQDYNSGHPQINHPQYFQSSRDFCMAKQIYAFTNLQTIYFYSFPSIREIYSKNVYRDLGQIAFQENSSMLLTTFLDNSEIFIWNFIDQLQLKQKLVFSSMPLNVSFYSSMIVFQTMNSVQLLNLENKQIQKLINIPEQSVKLSSLFKFYNTKQSKDQQIHLCLRSNTLIFIKE